MASEEKTSNTKRKNNLVYANHGNTLRHDA